MPRSLPWVFLLSGMGSLGAQVIWAKLFAIGLGHEIPSVFSVVSAVMAGLAVGSLGWPRKPAGMPVLRAYCYLELVLGLEEIVVEAGEELEGFLAFRFEDDPVRKAAMRSAIEGGAGPAFGGDSPATFATIYA